MKPDPGTGKVPLFLSAWGAVTRIEDIATSYSRPWRFMDPGLWSCRALAGSFPIVGGQRAAKSGLAVPRAVEMPWHGRPS